MMGYTAKLAQCKGCYYRIEIFKARRATKFILTVQETEMTSPRKIYIGEPFYSSSSEGCYEHPGQIWNENRVLLRAKSYNLPMKFFYRKK